MTSARPRRSFLLSLLALAAVSCGSATFVVQQYDGPARAKQSIAIVRVRGDQSVRLIALDGGDANAAIASDARLHIEVLPGLHTLHVGNAEAPHEPVQSVTFMAEAGRYYGVGFVRVQDAPSARPRVYEIREDSDAPVRDVTLVRPEPRPSAEGDAGG